MTDGGASSPAGAGWGIEPGDSPGMPLPELREQCFARDGWRCVWPGCGETRWLQMAHLRHRGMGGSPSANTLANVATCCSYHHDVLDGRTVAGRRHAVGALLAGYLQCRTGHPRKDAPSGRAEAGEGENQMPA